MAHGKRWDGSAWVDVVSAGHRWDGVAWQQVKLGRRWDGSNWVPVWPKITATDRSVSAVALQPATATAGFRYLTTGQLQTNVNFSYGNVSGEVANPTRTAWGDNFKIRAVLVSGNSPSGSAVGSYINMTSDVEWYIQRGALGTESTVIDVEILYALNNVQVYLARMTMGLTVESGA